jgi:tRNA(Ile)-lysidine synthase
VPTVASVRQRIAAALARAGVTAGDRVAVACSHGPDSLALADALLALRQAEVCIIYVHHGLRPEADAEARAVEDLARAAGVPAVIARARVVRADEGLEAAARAARYAALERTADELGARWVALGHTATDQAETVLGRLLRGAGPLGLAGIPPVRGRFVRPLLGIDRATVVAYLAERGLTPSHDAMNDDRAFLRARLRHEHLPALRRENPALDSALGRAAAALRETAEALDWAAERALEEIGEGDRLPVAALARLPPAIAKRALAKLAHGLEGRHLDALLALVQSPPVGSKSLALPGVVARREYGHLVFSRSGPTALEVTVAGADGPYRVRRFTPGDRMRPLALRGRSRKLQDLFTDRKIPAAARRAAVVVVRDGDDSIVWAQHVGAAFGVEIQVSLTGEDPTVIYDRRLFAR